MASALLGGDASVSGKAEGKRKQIDEAVVLVDAADSQYGQELATSAQWKQIKDEWQGLRGTVLNLTQKESGAAHTALIAKMLAKSWRWQAATV